MKRAIGYARVSTLTQRDNETIEEQVAALREYAEKNGVELVDIYRDDGISGADEDRVLSLVRFVQDRAQDFDVLIFTYFDRFSRDLFFQLFLEKEMKKAGKTLLAIFQENLEGDDPMTVAMRAMAGVFAELEKNMIVRRLAAGRRHKTLSRGVKASGDVAFGYRYEGAGTALKMVAVVPENAQIVREMFAGVIAGESLAKVAKKLNERGVLNGRGSEWSRQGVATVLKNDFYTGKVEWNGQIADGKHEAIITPSRFGKARASLKKRRKRAQAA